ncbi:MAG: HAMP domain-containing protein, partial [Nitrospirae bacterium]|nr:HAMP domain-containing protein [Nitrospirota bacterium]
MAESTAPPVVRSLRGRLLALLGAVLVIAAVGYCTFAYLQVARPLEARLLEKARTLNKTTTLAVRATREEDFEHTLAPLTLDAEVSWLEIYRADGTAAYSHSRVKPPTPVIAALQELAPGQLDLRDGPDTCEVWGKATSLTVHEDGSTAETVYYVRTAIGKAALAEWRRNALLMLVAFSAALTLLLLLVMNAPVSRLARRLNEMTSAAMIISQGDLSRPLRDASPDEVGALGRALGHVAQGLSRAIGHVQSAISAMQDANQTLEASSQSLREGAQLQKDEFEKAHTETVAMGDALGQVAKEAEGIGESTTRVSASIQEMDASTREMRNYFASLMDHLARTASSISQMTASITSIAESAKNLRHVSDESTAATKTLAQKTEEISRRALDSARLSREAQTAAERGSDMLRKTSESTKDIFQTFTVINNHTQTLDTELRKITEVVQVIEDLADRTNVLSLNAAIIAAQAKEHGKSFMVVADEMKQLANSTTNSLRVIETTVTSVLEKGVQVRKAVETGEERVKRGLTLSDEMGQSLRSILEHLATAAETAQEISQLTRGQKEGTDSLRFTIEQVQHMSQAISQATGEQSASAEIVHRSTEQLRAIAAQGTRMVAEQADASNHVAKGIQTILSGVEQLQSAKEGATERGRQIEQGIERVQEVVLLSMESIEQIAEKAGELGEVAEQLQAEIVRFQSRTARATPPSPP